MNRKLIFAILSAFTLQLYALNVENVAGDLGNRVNDLNITSLAVSGTMNANDFYFIADNLHRLETVDLSNVSIVKCELATNRYWVKVSPANELPICAFAGTDVTSVVLPSGLKSIGEGAFAACHRLTTVTWPANLDSIAAYAFAGCTSLTTVTIPASVEVLGTGAFVHCTSLTSFGVEAASRLVRVEDCALMDCPALVNVSFGTGVRSIGERVLAGTGVSHLDLRASTGLNEIGDWAAVLSPLQKVTLPASVTSVGDGAFLYDSALVNVTLGGHVSSLSDYLLAGTGLNDELDLTGVSRIGDFALYNVSGLSVVELPETVTWLGTHAMAGMSGLTALTSNATRVPSLGQEVWAGVPQRQIPLTVPSASQSRYQEAEQWKEFLFEITWLRGDVNGDGEVNIADINTLISIILGTPYDEQTLMRADVNGDGEIGVADINAVIDIILNQGNHAPAVIDTDDALHMDDAAIAPGEQRTLSVMLDNAAAYSAMQFDITLPMGLTLVDARTTQGQVSQTHDMDGATTRTLLYSMDKRHFKGDGKAVLLITVLADEALAADGQITLSNIVLADDLNQGLHAADCTARMTNTTGVEDLTANADRIWVEGRTLCIETASDCPAQLTAVNGMTHTLNATAGISRHQLERGFYVVVLNGKSHKIAIK